tara:strand:+ start:194 stop:439 length:246 start_codon:yes stop_codon:yes gene_type:complete
MIKDKKKINEVKQIIAKITKNPIKKLNHNSSYKNTKNWDSLAHINIILGIEKKLKKKFSLEEISNIENLRDCLNLYKKYKK